MKKCVVCGEKERAKFSVCCDSCHGESFVSTLKPVGDTDLVIDYPSSENGSSQLVIASVWELKKHDCFDGENNISIFDKENDIFESQLKEFFSMFEADGFTEEQNVKIREEINNWIDALPDELPSVFFSTVAGNIEVALDWNKKRNEMNAKLDVLAEMQE